MTDNELFSLLIATLQAGFTAQNITVGIRQSFQPTQQGAPSGPCVFLHKLGDHRYGTAQRSVVYSGTHGQGTLTETQQYETKFQIDALAIQNPANVSDMTASDYVNTAALILASDLTVANFSAQGVGILRVTDVRNTFFMDDKSRNEASPSFDVVITHTRAFVSHIPFTDIIIGNINLV